MQFGFIMVTKFKTKRKIKTNYNFKTKHFTNSENGGFVGKLNKYSQLTNSNPEIF